jgi:hypothetical protein
MALLVPVLWFRWAPLAVPRSYVPAGTAAGPRLCRLLGMLLADVRSSARRVIDGLSQLTS